MASTFDENKKMKCDQSSCQSWFKHIGIEKSNNYTVQFFSARRNTKTSSKSDESTDLSTTDQGNGQDTGLEEGEVAEDADPDLHPLRSDWNELCLVYCDKCDYLYAHQAFMRHQEVRHSQQQDPYLYQHRLYKKKPEPTPTQEHKERRKTKNGNKSTTDKLNIKQVRTDDSKNNDSESNVVNKTDVKSGPGPGKSRKKRKRQFGTKRRKRIVRESNEETSLQNVTESVIKVLENCEETSLQIVTENSIEETENRLEVNCQLRGGGAQNCMVEYPIDVESPVLPVAHGCSMQLEDVPHFGNFSSENLVINQSTNSMKMLSVPPLVDKAQDCSNSENTQSLLCKIKLTNPQLTKNNIFSYDNSLIHNSSHTYGSPSKMGRSLNEDDARNKLKSRTGCTLPNDCTRDTVNQNVIREKLHNGTPPKRFNGNLKKESAQRNSSVICVETLKQDSSFHNENNAYLDSLGDGSQLSSRKCVRKTKPDVKLKSQQIKEKLKTALASPVYEQCLQTIKLEPIKIKKALSSINRVCKARTIEQFRTFSHLKRIMPSGKNSPHRTRVSCSVNTGAKSACIKSWNKVPFRYQSRKCFFPLSGSLQAESGLVLSDSPYKTLRATFNQNGLDTSPIQFQESDFITTDTPYQSAVEIGELNDEGFAALETDIYEGQQNGSFPSPNASSPWDSNLMNGNQPDSGYLSNYDRDGGHQQQTSTMRGSPISSTCSPESWDNIVDHQEPELVKPASIHREDSSQIILLFPKDLSRRENGINGIYQDYNREQNQGCKDR